MRVPEVVTLTRYDRYREAVVTFSRRNILKRDHATCQYCGVQPGSEELTIDHVVPRSQGGATTWENCVLACVACNARKANRTPERSGMLLRRHPFRPSWKPLYSAPNVKIASWTRFISEAYWNVPMEEVPGKALEHGASRHSHGHGHAHPHGHGHSHSHGHGHGHSR